mgnify:CR=1 FL=1
MAGAYTCRRLAGGGEGRAAVAAPAGSPPEGHHRRRARQDRARHGSARCLAVADAPARRRRRRRKDYYNCGEKLVYAIMFLSHIHDPSILCLYMYQSIVKKTNLFDQSILRLCSFQFQGSQHINVVLSNSVILGLISVHLH